MNERLVVIGGVDISRHIAKDTYKMDSESIYESWTDGNYHEHRIPIRNKVKGSFEVTFLDEDNGAYQDFLDLLDSATDDEILTMGAFVQNTSSFEALQVYYKITTEQHAITTDERMVNKMKIDVEEY